MITATRWFDDVLNPEGAEAVTVALPYAGAAGRAFRPLHPYLPDGCALALVDLPGHGRRMSETCLRDAEAVIDGVLDAIGTLGSRRLVLLGYSLGGWLAYEIATRLTEAGTPPAGLIVCGTRAPHHGIGHPPVAHLPAGETFLREAVAMGLASPAMLELPGLADLFATALHADLTVVQSFAFRPRPPLPVPACVVGFDADWLVPEPALRAWDDLCAAPPLHQRLMGGHLAMHDQQEEFGTAIRAGLDHVLGVRKEG
ncbi:thioesterase II family protein [Micromonospora chokoriensis]|uniref:thioesterase II family protein n=1 Tax=Micromonospora chokoriensis TaxID=356851 RepID=UPI0004C44BF1|nr:alpha/beta fold hydrolase [Micromonospora chokoriensis]